MHEVPPRGMDSCLVPNKCFDSLEEQLSSVWCIYRAASFPSLMFRFLLYPSSLNSLAAVFPFYIGVLIFFSITWHQLVIPSNMVVPASNGKTVLITGINGYISSVLGLHLLAKGYSVRGTTRRRTSSEPLLIGPYASYKERVEIYEVPDITVSGAFDKAARGK